MARKKSVENLSRTKPATTPEARENQLIALAVDLAEKQMREGTASAQVIVHYLKLGSSRGKLENQMLSQKTDLLTAQTESIQSAKRIEELYSEALSAMRLYSGQSIVDEVDDEY